MSVLLFFSPRSSDTNPTCYHVVLGIYDLLHGPGWQNGMAEPGVIALSYYPNKNVFKHVTCDNKRRASLGIIV